MPPTESEVIEGESRSSAEESGGADRTAEAGERKSSGVGGSTHHLHTVPPNGGQGLHLCQPFLTQTMIGALHLSYFFFFQLQERITDLEEERDLIKDNYNTLLEK